MKAHRELLSLPSAHRRGDVPWPDEQDLILHVDDDPDTRMIVKLALEILGSFKVFQFGSGAEAIARVDQLAPELMLLNVSTPDMAGQELWRQLTKHQALKDVPVVFLIGVVEDPLTDELLDECAMSVIAKPIDPKRPAQQIEKIWQLR